jgi:hypothetical protein
MNNLANGVALFVLGALGLAAFFIVLAALFPTRLGRTRAIAGRSPGRAFVVGLINTFFVIVLALAFLAVSNWTSIQFLALPALLLLGLLALGLTFGLGGVVLLLGERLLPERPPLARTAFAAVALGLACAVPYVGWFGLYPYAALLGLGAFILSFFEPAAPVA